jgi:hypothetical protein
VTLTLRTTCRGCGGALQPFLALGDQPLANRLRRPDDRAPVAAYPLTLCRCLDCQLVQLREVVDPALLFADYAYVPSTSSTMRAHFDEFAGDAVHRLRLTEHDLVVDVGSNDGLLLSCFQRRGIAAVICLPRTRRQPRSGIPTHAAFFSSAVARELGAQRRAALVTATNVFAHVDDVRGFIRAAFELLAPDGVFMVEVQSFADTVSSLAFDMTYHEHMTYYATAPLARLRVRCSCSTWSASRPRGTLGPPSDVGAPAGAPPPASPRASRRKRTASPPVPSSSPEGRSPCVASCAPLDELNAAGASVAAYGAPAKATVLLNYCGLGARDVRYVVDRNEAKQGQDIPGADIPVVGPQRLIDDPPTHLLLLAWNLTNEIVREQEAFAAAGGRFIVPVPQPRLLD